MVMTEWMREVRKALETIPKDTPNRLKAAMEKAKLTYKKGSSTSAAASHSSMKKSHKYHKQEIKVKKACANTEVKNLKDIIKAACQN
jgi:hypothetical protein